MPVDGGRESKMKLRMLDNHGWWIGTNQGEERQNVVLAPNWPTVMKFHQTGQG